jgi:hypothetical protein
VGLTCVFGRGPGSRNKGLGIHGVVCRYSRSTFQGAGCRVQGAGCRVRCAGRGVQGVGLILSSAGCGERGTGCRIKCGVMCAAHLAGAAVRGVVHLPRVQGKNICARTVWL